MEHVNQFDCGDAVWERDLAGWIRDPERALKDIEQGCQVWLWADNNGTLVGFGSLGITSWRVPNPNKSAPQTISVVPAIALSSAYQGKPVGVAPKHRYARIILEDIIAEAIAYVETRPFIGLFVHVDNKKAIAFYKRAGFDEFGKPFLEKQTGWFHQKMLYDLRRRSLT